MGLSCTQTQKIVITNQGNDLVARVGALRILFSANDCFFADNSDPDSNYGAKIKITIKEDHE